jgi:short-subunit dehydrogenase
MELQGTGIGTTVVHPGGVKTNIARNALLKGSIHPDKHQKAIATFEQKAMTTAESAARQILDAVAKNKARLLVGRDARLIDIVARLLPVGYTRILYARLKKAFGQD